MIQVLHNSRRRFCDILSFWSTDISQTWQGVLLRSINPYGPRVFSCKGSTLLGSILRSRAPCQAGPPCVLITYWCLCDTSVNPFCLGYTTTYGDIDIFCTKTAFDKFIQKVAPLEADIRLVRYNRLLLQRFPQLLQHDGWREHRLRLLGIRFWSFQRLLLGGEDKTPGDGGLCVKISIVNRSLYQLWILLRGTEVALLLRSSQSLTSTLFSMPYMEAFTFTGNNQTLLWCQLMNKF